MFTAIETPIWRARLWVDPYVKYLDFMTESSTYNKYAISIDNVVIDFISYLEVRTMIELRGADRTWMIDPNDSSILYVHFAQHNPPFRFLSFKSGLLLGFSYGDPIRLGEIKTYPTLIDIPVVEDSADNLTYKKMAFSSGDVSVDNSTGMLDDLIELFGNDLTLLSVDSTQQVEIIRQYFIERYTIGLDTVKFTCQDKRSRLTFKAPNTFYTKEKYPHIEENIVDKVIQDAYGFCRGIKGTCVNQNEIYSDPVALTFNNWFRFKFSRKITSIREVWVEMSDVWTQVFPGLGVPGNSGSGNTGWASTNPNPIKILTRNAQTGLFTVQTNVTTSNMNNLPDNDGHIDIWWSQALRDNPGFLERRNGKPNRVKMTGVFVNFNNPGDIIKDMMTYYGDLPYDASYFDMNEWQREMAGGKQIGICLDKSDDIYSWIEKIQNGAMLGFQLLVYRNLFSARLDNPNREETFNIHWSEILNRATIEPEFNGDDYATFTTINYNKDYTEDEYLTIVDQSQRLAILDVYKYEKEYENDSYLINESDVQRKGRIVLENFMDVRPMFRNIELNGFRWNEIQLFSTGFIDFSIETPRQMKIIQKHMKKRNFMGKLRVKVLGCRRDLKLQKTWIDVIQCDRLGALM